MINDRLRTPRSFHISFGDAESFRRYHAVEVIASVLKDSGGSLRTGCEYGLFSGMVWVNLEGGEQKGLAARRLAAAARLHSNKHCIDLR